MDINPRFLGFTSGQGNFSYTDHGVVCKRRTTLIGLYDRYSRLYILAVSQGHKPTGPNPHFTDMSKYDFESLKGLLIDLVLLVNLPTSKENKT